MSLPGVFGLPHLSEDAVAAFADGVLAPAAAARARRHCAECAECSDAVRVQRETTLLLRSSRAPSLPSGLLDRLTGLPGSTTLPPRAFGAIAAVDADGSPMFRAFDRRSNGDDSGAAEQTDHGPANHGPLHFGLRRAALPVGLIASAAAVLAVGAFGAQTRPDAPGGGPDGSANISGVLPAADRSTQTESPASPLVSPAVRTDLPVVAATAVRVSRPAPLRSAP
jgi:hypothetical protein